MPRLVHRFFLVVLLAACFAALAVWPPRTASAREVAVRRFSAFNIPVGDTADIITSSITGSSNVPGNVVTVRVTVTLNTTGSVLEFVETTGGDTVVSELNGGTALTADAKYAFEFSSDTAWSWNLRCQTSGGRMTVVIDEVRTTP